MELSARQGNSNRPFGSWADDLAVAFVQLEPRRVADLPFRGAIVRQDANPIRVSRVTATKHRVLRLRSHIARSTDDLCFINLQLEGVGRYLQRGHVQICAPGDMALVDTTEPFEIANTHDFRLFCFAVPRHLVPSCLLGSPRLSLTATEMGRALSRTLVAYADLCLTSPFSSEIPALGGSHIVDLISQIPSTLEQVSSESIKVPVLLSMMIDHIDRHIVDPDLSAVALARQFHCSERYVHKLFSTTEQTVGEHINARRIQLCTRNLLDPGVRKTISEIAYAAGFRDISYFNHLFKRSLGMAPREFRRSMSATNT
ncbi:helix-turn-helix domain-containing protein [Bradyrhizobium jicamae]|nr:helix-turn-helix domain-containing protein [Bradyrhizobium jicamae]